MTITEPAQRMYEITFTIDFGAWQRVETIQRSYLVKANSQAEALDAISKKVSFVKGGRFNECMDPIIKETKVTLKTFHGFIDADKPKENSFNKINIDEYGTIEEVKS